MPTTAGSQPTPSTHFSVSTSDAISAVTVTAARAVAIIINVLRSHSSLVAHMSYVLYRINTNLNSQQARNIPSNEGTQQASLA